MVVGLYRKEMYHISDSARFHLLWLWKTHQYTHTLHAHHTHACILYMLTHVIPHVQCLPSCHGLNNTHYLRRTDWINMRSEGVFTWWGAGFSGEVGGLFLPHRCTSHRAHQHTDVTKGARGARRVSAASYVLWSFCLCFFGRRRWVGVGRLMFLQNVKALC